MYHLSWESSPTSYDEIWKLTKIARILRLVTSHPNSELRFYTHFFFTYDMQKLLRSTVSWFKYIIERAEKEKFAPGKVTIIEPKEFRTPSKPKKQKQPKSGVSHFDENC